MSWYILKERYINMYSQYSILCRDLWEYLSNLSIDMNRLTDSIKEDPDKIAIHLKTAPEKRYLYFPLKS